jgi:hypothetical protein
MGNGVLGFGAGLVVGIPLGIVGNLVAGYLWEGPISRWRSSRRLRLSDAEALSYLSESDHMYTVASWSPARMLTRQHLRTEFADVEPRLGLVDAGKWHEAYVDLETRSDVHGRCGYVTAAGPIDWREGPTTQIFRVTISPADYRAGIATYLALLEDPSRQDYINWLLKETPFAFITQAPPSHLAVNMGILSADGRRFLGVRRSGAVATAPNVWTVGPCETFTLEESVSPGAPEDFFSLAERCLAEELGLGRDDYDRLSISWFGYRGPDAHPWITAQARVKLSDNEVKQLWHTSHSRPEASAIDWFTFDRQTIAAVIFGTRSTAADKSWAPVVEVAEGECIGKWFIHAPHALHEMWRMRAAWMD